ncbi:MAG TPA: S53 family peptidase [Acidimicrobiales bacterium]|nr:S53 family peptidase [Acidimicrobiales bacterium]
MGRFRRRLVLGSAGTVLLAGSLAWAGASGTATATASPAATRPKGLVLHPMVQLVGDTPQAAPPTEGWCLRNYGILCYGATQVEAAYGLPTLYRQNLDGHGETIVIVDSFGAPDIREDLAVFDRAYGLTAPPHFTILKYGDVPAYTPTTPTATGWAQETTLDVEWSHAIAPGANILLVETATAETVGTTGFPTMVNAENYVIDHHLGDVISQSFGTGEATFSAPGTILGLRSAYENAYRSGITVLAAAGDTGVAYSETVTKKHYFSFPDVGWPASDPLVTAVGGTELTLNPRGVRVAPDRVWNDTQLFGYPAASSGGLSTVFTRPSYQNSVAGVVGSRRGVPDISMSASVSGAVNIYYSGLASGNGWNPIGGTSEASPLFSGIVAIADQLNGHRPLGLLNPAIYAMEAAHDPGIVDVTAGTNSVYYTTAGKTITITGYPAVPGYNLAAGVGTVTAPKFVRELVQTAQRVGTAVTYGESPTSFLPVG